MLDNNLSATCQAQAELRHDVRTLGWFRRHRKRLAQIGTGHLLYATCNWFFDNILYVFVVYRLGLLVGGLIMTMASLVVSVATLLVYERMRIDWVGVGSLAQARLRPEPILVATPCPLGHAPGAGSDLPCPLRFSGSLHHHRLFPAGTFR